MLKFSIIITAVIMIINAVIYILKKRKNKNALCQTHITVTGTAQNKDGFAKVVVDVSDSYCIDGMELWQTDWLNKKIKVVGDLEIREIRSPSKIYADKIKFIKSAVVYLTKK